MSLAQQHPIFNELNKLSNHEAHIIAVLSDHLKPLCSSDQPLKQQQVKFSVDAHYLVGAVFV